MKHLKSLSLILATIALSLLFYSCEKDQVQTTDYKNCCNFCFSNESNDEASKENSDVSEEENITEMDAVEDNNE